MSERDKSKSELDRLDQAPDESTAIMVYGNLKIIDVQTGETLVNKRA